MHLRAYRAEHGLTLKVFAARIGVSEVALSRYETGARMPRRETMEAIRLATDGVVTANDFVHVPAEPASEAA